MVKEKSNHLHCAIFMHDAKQRSNVIATFLNNPLKHYDDDEKKNFRKYMYDRDKKTGAVINMTTLGMVADYMSGDHEGKEQDDFEVILDKLPDGDTGACYISVPGYFPLQGGGDTYLGGDACLGGDASVESHQRVTVRQFQS